MCKEKSLKKCHICLIFHGGADLSETLKIREIGESDSYTSFLDENAKKGMLSHLHFKRHGVVVKV